MTWRAVLLAVVTLFGVLAAPSALADDRGPADLVWTDNGPVQGVVHADHRSFEGIPFAAPPVGELRWRPPQPAARWREPLDASAPRSACPQTPQLGQPGSENEDCLYLNVLTPVRARHRLPVMVWIHGGAYETGSGSFYRSPQLAVDGDVVVVTVNYRLGVFGFLALPELTGEQPGIQSGNYGLEDQQAALRWVRRNAAAFGGDPGNVTIFGESAGGGSVCQHLVSPTAKGLFHKAIGQSMSCAAPVRGKQAAEQHGVEYRTTVGCADVGCLRAKPVTELLRNWSLDFDLMTGGHPVAGGREFPLQPPDALRRDRFNHVPVIWGNTRDEMRLFISLQYDGTGNPVTPQRYEQIIRETYGAAADRVLRKYPVTAYPSPSIALATVLSDGRTSLSTCEHLRTYDLMAAPPRPVPVYAYQFADRTAPPLFDVPGFEEGAEHGTELNYLWENLFGTLNPQQQELSRTMVRYWTNFAHHGNPNGPGVPRWQRYSSPGDVQSLDVEPGGVRPVDVAATSNCAFWAGLNPS